MLESPDRDGIGEGETDIADGDIEGHAADAVGHAHEEGHEHAVSGRFGQHLPQLGDGEQGADDGPEQPAPGGLRQPVGFPGPALDVFLRGVTVGRKARTDGVQADTKQRVGRDRIHQIKAALARRRRLARNISHSRVKYSPAGPLLQLKERG